MTSYRDFRLSRLNEPQFRHLKLLLFWPLFGALFFALEWVLPARDYIPMHHPLDDLISFNELFVIPYVYWYIFMVFGVLYTCFREPEVFRKLTMFFAITFGGSILIFLLYPTCQNFRPAVMPRDNLLTRIMFFLYDHDTNTNVCPSLHVVGSIGIAMALNRTQHFSTRRWKILNGVSAFLISISTLFVRQHSVWDVFWGVVFSFAAWFVVYRIPAKREVTSLAVS